MSPSAGHEGDPGGRPGRLGYFPLSGPAQRPSRARISTFVALVALLAAVALVASCAHRSQRFLAAKPGLVEDLYTGTAPSDGYLPYADVPAAGVGAAASGTVSPGTGNSGGHAALSAGAPGSLTPLPSATGEIVADGSYPGVGAHTVHALPDHSRVSGEATSVYGMADVPGTLGTVAPAGGWAPIPAASAGPPTDGPATGVAGPLVAPHDIEHQGPNGGTAAPSGFGPGHTGTRSIGSSSDADGGATLGGPSSEKATTTSTTLTTRTTTNTTTGFSSITLYCWALMMPHGYEVSLIRTMLTQGVSLFGCDDYTVFSSGDIELSPGPPVRIGTKDIGSVKCNYGGKWYLALNSQVFIKVWKAIFKEKKYEHHDWTVKIDPDAVFLPDRLRKQVFHSDSRAVVYLNNCDQGLHGPIEVIALGGMRVFDEGIKHCEEKLSYEFGEWGEDVFLRHCLGMLKVNRVDNFKLLSEDRCFYENPAQNGCTSGKAAFHPFKKPDTYFKCLKEAKASQGHEEHEQEQHQEEDEHEDKD